MTVTIIETNLTFKSMSTRSATNRLILHHAAATSCTAENIHSWHLANGWSGAGYHFLVRKDATIYRLRPEKYVGAHASGANSDSIGICFEGNFVNETMSDAQAAAGAELVSYLLDKYGISKVQKHSDVSATACPGTNFPFDTIASGGTSTSASTSSSSSTSGTSSSSSSSSSSLSAGTKVTLSNVALYSSSTSTTKAATKSGTYYIWSASTSNGRIRITNSSSNVGVANQVTGWVNVSDISSSGSSTSSSSSNSSSSLVAGAKVSLSKVALYSSSTSTSKAATVTGTYYLWDANVKNSRIRITNSTANVGVSGQVTGWVNVSDL